MPVPTLISQLSTTPSSNSPSGSESTITNDDYLRTLSAFLAQVRDGVGITPTASITFPAGSAAAPSVTFVGDTDTGIYAPSANQLAVTLNGTRVVNFSTSTGANCEIIQPVAQVGLRIASDAGVPAFVFRDRSINASAHVSGSILFDVYRDVSDPSFAAGIWCSATSAAGNTGDLVFGTAVNATASSPPERLRIVSDGRVYGTGLHNNGSVSGTANQYIASGTYTPTMTGVLNVSAANGLKSQWMRVGNVVTVSGSCQITTAAATTTSCGLELPIPSNLASPGDCIGTIQQNIGTPVAGLLSLAGDTVNDRANITFTAVAASNNTYYFTFTYEVL